MAKNEVNMETLWRYADGECTDAERQEVEQALSSDANWQREWAVIQALQRDLQALTPEQPSMRFAKNVMESLPSAAKRLESISFLPAGAKIAWGSFFVILVLGGLYLFLNPTQGAFWPEWLQPAVSGLEVPDWSKLLSFEVNANVGLLAAIFLSLMLILALDHVFEIRGGSRKRLPGK